MAIHLLDGRVLDENSNPEEVRDLTKDIAPDDGEKVQRGEPTGNPLYDRWAAEEESINEHGHL